MVHSPEQRILVGIDGSPESLAALRWALREAATRDAIVEVVHCWQPHSLADLVLAKPEELRRGSVCMVRNEVSAALAELGEDKPAVEEVSRRGRPAPVLIERAVDARLLVLGAHGHTALQDVVFGQVTASCLRHSSCPVVIVDRTETVLQHTGRAVSSTPA